VTANSIVPNNKIWSVKVQENIEAYEVEMNNKVHDFRKLDFWAFETGPGAARDKMKVGKSLEKKKKGLRIKLVNTQLRLIRISIISWIRDVRTLQEAEARLNDEKRHLEKNAHLCRIFEFPDAIKKSAELISTMVGLAT